MSLRTQEEFFDAVAQEISWRRRELSELKLLVETSDNQPLRQAAAVRSSIALLYAHWEGFVKRLAEFYLNFVSMQRLSHEELSNCMLALSVRSKLNSAGSSKHIQAHVEVVQYLRTNQTTRARVPFRDIVRTQSNLSSSVFSELLATIGLSSVPYESKYKLLDNQLLAKRNSIAHGEELNVSAAEYHSLHEQVAGLINLFQSEIENAVLNKLYKRGQPDAPPSAQSHRA